MITAGDKALSQDKIVLGIFRSHKRPLTPSQVHAAGFAPSTPMTSIRRAITTLTHKGDLVKTVDCVKGPHGSPEYLWRVA